MRVDARTSAMSRAGHDVADEQDLGVAVEREAEAIDLVVGFDHALRDRGVVRAQRVQRLAQAHAGRDPRPRSAVVPESLALPVPRL